MNVCVCVCKNVQVYLCITNDYNKQASPCVFFLTFLPLSPPVLSSQTAVLTCVMGMASAPWGSRVGTANARRAGGDLAAVLRWRPLALTTRTMKEVIWGKWENVFEKTLLSASRQRISPTKKRLHAE